MMVGGGLPIIACMNVNLDDVMCDIANDDQAHNRVLCQMEQKYYAAKYIMCTFSLDS